MQGGHLEFPAIQGVQAGRRYYVSMCPLRHIPRIFLFDEEELVPELRAQRTLNKGRVPEISRYIVENRNDYVFSAITASVDGDLEFTPYDGDGTGGRVGSLRIPLAARFIINDGQHRRAAIESALREQPDLAEETIAVVFFHDRGLERCQQMFADLNRHAVRPSRSLGVLYDQRDVLAHVTRLVVAQDPLLRELVEMERSTLSARSRRLFTLSAVYGATKALLEGTELDVDEAGQKAAEYWREVAKSFPEWEAVRARRMSSGEIRRDFLHSHAVVLQALGRVGNALLWESGGKGWKRQLRKLRSLDWSRSNSKLWEGRALSAGRVSKAGQHVRLTTNLIKHHLGLPLSPEDQRVEDAFLRGARGK